MYARIRPLLWTAGSFAIVFAVWELVVRILAMPEDALPGPGPVFASLTKNFVILASQAWWTAATVLVGFIVAAAFAIPLAMVIVISPVLERLIYPPMVATQSIRNIWRWRTGSSSSGSELSASPPKWRSLFSSPSFRS